MKNFLLTVDEKGVNRTLASFLGRMLEDGVVGSVLAPLDTTSGKSTVMTLVKSPEALESINPFAPVSMVNAARIVSDLTSLADPGEKIGALIRSCESRALVELAKHNQARLDDIVIIGMDCLGTFDPEDYSQICQGGNLTAEWMNASSGSEYGEEIRGKTIRRACRACGHVETEHAAVHLGWVGLVQKTLLVTVNDELADWASSIPGAETGQVPEGRSQALDNIRSRREENSKRLYEEFSTRTGSVDLLLSELAGCLNCHNCRQACPLCFCRECVFSSEIFRHDPEYYLSRAGRKGLMGMPTGKLLFHLTRVNHMAMGCVGCGHCESACPSNIPLGIIFRMVGEKMQQLFDYVPGRSLEEDPPLTTYREVELDPR